MADRYNVRNVAQKEVYDSYMGILRISPNLVYEVDEDDATEMLETLSDFRNEYGDEVQEIKVQLSDSDGNPLPVYFIPRAFKTNITISSTSNALETTRNLINICSKTDDLLFISNKMDARSTISVIMDNYENKPKKSLVTIITGGQPNTIENFPQASNILQYPIENPNDDFFFNKDNSYKLEQTDENGNAKYLFDPTITNKPRHVQMEENLFNQSLDWYKNVLTKEKDRTRILGFETDQQVKVAGKAVNTFNVDNEDVPVFYTRDYVLGHYEGHTVKGKDNVNNAKDNWVDEMSGAQRVVFDDDTDTFTRLSWIRFDDLIWDTIDEIISGKIRHSGSGRYTDMGAQNDSGTKIIEELFGIGDESGQEGISQLSDKGGISALDDTAPILGQSVQEGLIMYHAMPLHRFWFHRCRQIIYNMERYSKLKNKDNPNSVNWIKYSDDIIEEVDVLQTHKNNGLITGCCRASITPHHSLVKDFLFCNGQTVKFENYPNISLTNYNLLVNDSPGKEAELLTDNKFGNRTSGVDTWSTGTYKAIQQSINNGDYIKTPNLFAFNETYPRFIRGLSWETGEDYIKDDMNAEGAIENAYPIENYGASLNSTVDSRWVHSSRFEQDDNGKLTEKGKTDIYNDKDIWGADGINIKKPIKNVALYHYNYDFASKKQNHVHKLFSNYIGGKSNEGFNSHKFSNLAAFYTFGMFSGVVFLVSSNESNGDTPFYFNGYVSNDYSYDGTYCLALTSNYDNSTGTNAAKWTEYCLKPESEVTFHDFTPVSNLGLMLWNSDIYNTDNGDYKGTTSSIEDGTSGAFYKISYPDNIKERDDTNFINENIHFRGDNYQINTSKEKDNYSSMNIFRMNRFKRKQQAIKFNEADGRIPISYIGYAKYRLEEGHMIQRKHSKLGSFFSGDKYDTEPITVFKNNIGNYILKSANITEKSEDGDMGWSCLTSLPYEFPEYLGYGDWRGITTEHYAKSFNIEDKLTNPASYYINHNVTDRWRKVQPEEKIQIVKYGGVEIKSDIQAPAPAHMYLLPLIRL